MEVVKNEKPTMSEFCEYLMDSSEIACGLKKEGDVALVMCSDGNVLACRIQGSPLSISNLVLKKMLADSMFVKAISLAVHHYIEGVSDVIGYNGPINKQSETSDDHGKEESN